MKRNILLWFLVFGSLALSAQENYPVPTSANRPLNGFVVNLLGNGSNVSLNYERLFRINDYVFLSGSLGAGFGRQLSNRDPVQDTITTVRQGYLAIPAMITFNGGKGRHFVEAGIGSTAAIGNVYPHLLYFLTAGYRLQPLRSGNLSLRIYGNLLLNNNEDFRNLYFVPFGASIGVAF
jgi:hypothetical protein